jgi:hypothetical protein
MADRGGAEPRRRLPDYAGEPEVTAHARAADLALLAEAVRRVQALAGALAELRKGAGLLTTGHYFDLVRDGLADLGDWPGDAVGELKATPTPAKEAAFRAEHAELHERLWRR